MPHRQSSRLKSVIVTWETPVTSRLSVCSSATFNFCGGGREEEHQTPPDERKPLIFPPLGHQSAGGEVAVGAPTADDVICKRGPPVRAQNCFKSRHTVKWLPPSSASRPRLTEWNLLIISSSRGRNAAVRHADISLRVSGLFKNFVFTASERQTLRRIMFSVFDYFEFFSLRLKLNNRGCTAVLWEYYSFCKSRHLKALWSS